MINTFDCIVVGGGLVGLLTARELAKNGLSIAVIEQYDIGEGASWAAAGILSSLCPWQESPATLALMEWSQMHYPLLAKNLTDRGGINPQWWQCGMWLSVKKAIEKEKITRWSAQYDHPISFMSSEKYLKIASQEYVVVALPKVAQIRPPRLIKALQCELDRLGVTVKTHTKVLDLPLRKQRAGIIKTDRGCLYGGQIVLASGAWSGKLSANLRQPLAVKPVRGQIICYQTRPGYVKHILLHKGFYAVPRKDGQLLVGSTLEDVGFNNEITHQAREQLANVATSLLPDIQQFKIVRQWSGLRPALQRDRPLIGPYPDINGLYVNTGHYRHGVLLAPASARLLSDIMLEREPIVPSENYALT